MREWRFLDTGHHNAAENIALDDIILECRAKGLIPDTLRFLQFDPPAVLVGYHQAVECEIRTEFCKSRGIEINRRLTGGGAILFDRTSLGWEIFASKYELDTYQQVEELYKKMCQGTILGLKSLGIKADFRPKNDIEINGRKISGTGGTGRGNSFLFQGTLLIDFDVDTMIRALRIPVMKLKDKEIESVKERVTCIKWELEHQPTLQEIKEALKEGFKKAFKIQLLDGELTLHEKSLLKDRLGMYQSEDWVFLDRRPTDESIEVSAIQKTPGGLIRASLAIDNPVNLIKSVLITGDFFVFPSRAILDLEANLKSTPCDIDEIRHVIYDFFNATKTQIPGVTPDDLIKLIQEAIAKTDYQSLGISLAETNHIYPVNLSTTDVLNKDWDVLLLPYCAKLPDCELRKKDGCEKCGKCSIGQAYELAEEIGLTPITIQNFEHLMTTLWKLKQNGAKGYIGCCCEGFYCKHQDDFETVDLPGILIDINDQTCYDLGKEREAYLGTFENQTELKIDLLCKVVSKLCRKRG